MNPALRENLLPMELDGPKEKIEQIAQAFRNVRAGGAVRDDTIPFSHVIPGAAREIYMAWRRPEPVACKPSRWHKKFQKRAKELVDMLAEMPVELVEDLFQNSKQKSELYQRLVWASSNSISSLSRKAGRPTNSQSKHLAIIVANFYFSLTGNPPTVTRDPITNKNSGEFYDLLASIFQTLEVKDDARSAAEFVNKKWGEIDKKPGSTAGIENILPRKRRYKD